MKSFRFDAAMKLNAGPPPTPSSSSSQDDLLSGAILGLLGDVKSEGAFVSPDKADITLKVAGQDVGFISIGDKSWFKFGSTWQATDPSDSLTGSSGSSGSPTDLFKDALPSDVLTGAKTSQETVNGVKTTHYAFDKDALQKLTKDRAKTRSDFATVDKANMDVWMNSDDMPVKMAFSVNGKDDSGQKVSLDLQINIKNINDGNIQIKGADLASEASFVILFPPRGEGVGAVFHIFAINWL